MQAETEPQPRMRFGLFEGFRKRHNSASAAGTRGPAGFRLWGSKLPLNRQSQAIAECEAEASEGVEDDAFQSPRCVLCSVVTCCSCLLAALAWSSEDTVS